MAVFLQQQFAADVLSECFFQAFLHQWDCSQLRLNNAAGGCGFREGLCQVRREALQPGMGILNIVLGQANIG